MNFFRQIMIQEKKILEKVSKNTSYLKVISLIIAILLFFGLNGSSLFGLGELFETTSYIPNINVNIISDDNKVISGIPEKIGINVRGSEVNVRKFEANANNITASINLSGRDDGKYKVDFKEFNFSQDYGIDIEPLVNTYDVVIDTKTQVTMPIDIKYINSSNSSPIILKEAKFETPTVTFEIGQMQKEEILSAEVILDLSDIDISKEESTHTFKETIKIYDKEGNPIKVEGNLPEVEIEQQYESNIILMPVKYNIINNDTKEYVSYVCEPKDDRIVDENCQDEVEVFGDQEIIQDLGYITYNVDLKDYDANSPDVTATPSLPNGVFVEGTSDKKVEIGLEKGKTINLKNVPITVENLDNSLEVVNLDNLNLNVKVTGADSVVDKMTSQDILVYIDASDIDSANKARLPLQVTINNLVTYELSEKEVNVEFREKS